MSVGIPIKANGDQEILLQVPDYGGKCIDQIPGFVRSVLLGQPGGPLADLASGKGCDLSGVTHVVVFLVDGFGHHQWQMYRNRLDVLKAFDDHGMVRPIDTVFPSSTPVALTTLNSNGRVPCEHGLIDWWMYVKDIDDIIATLPFKAMGAGPADSLLEAGLSAKTLYNGPTTFEALTAEGIKSRVIIKRGYANSAYSSVAHANAETIAIDDHKDLFVSLAKVITEPSEVPCYTYVYWGNIDETGHTYGLDSDEYNVAVETFFAEFSHFMGSIDQGTLEEVLYVVTADHGQVNIDPEKTFYLDELEGLELLFGVSEHGKTILPWGGPREVFLSIKPGECDRAARAIHDALGEYVQVIKAQDALEAGLLGKSRVHHPDLYSRMGDLIVLPTHAHTVWYRHPSNEPPQLKARHGGLTSQELQIPFAVARASDLASWGL